VSPTLANFLFEAANFLVLAAGLGWLLFKPVRRALAAESARHAQIAADAERARAEAAALAQDARKTRDSAMQQADAERAEIIAAAQREAARMLEETRAAQAAERQNFARELEASRRAQGIAMADTLGRIATAAVAKLLSTIDAPALDVALARAAASELSGLSLPVRASAVVESARPLAAEARRALEDLLGPTFEARIVPDLGAGVRVTTVGGQVDASALSIAREAARSVGAVHAEHALG
jgi:F0F1-type ATP synthase membrane subunit b/b'